MAKERGGWERGVGGYEVRRTNKKNRELLSLLARRAEQEVDKAVGEGQMRRKQNDGETQKTEEA